MDHARDYSTRFGDWVIDSMNPVFNNDGSIILRPSKDILEVFQKKYTVGGVVRFGSKVDREKFALCRILKINEEIIIQPLD